MGYEKLFGADWFNRLQNFINSGQLGNIAKKVQHKRNMHFIKPDKGSPLLFRAFRETPYNKVKVVIFGKEPYHAEENNHNVFDGIAYSNAGSVKAQPSLKNILDEVERDCYEGLKLDRSTKLSLYDWARQGVLLTNISHTIEQGIPGSHLAIWKPFTIEIVKLLNEKDDIVWMLWGIDVIKFKQYITNPSHHIICTSHPADKTVDEYPLFEGSGCFSECNRELEKRNKTKIWW